jgi:hypothetical protein
MTATAGSPTTTASPAVEFPPFPLPPEAVLVGGLFRSIDGPLTVMRALRRSGAAGDTVGLAVPLPGDPKEPATLEALATPPAKKRFDVLGYLKTVLDPHAPGPQYRSLIAGQNSALTRLVLKDMSGWIAGVKTFRIPPSMTGNVSKDEAKGGVWVLGRSNHAAAVAGVEGADLGGAVGALAGVGVPPDLVQAFAERIAGGEIVFTTCETDSNRAKRDARWMQKAGASDPFERVILSPRRAVIAHPGHRDEPDAAAG